MEMKSIIKFEDCSREDYEEFLSSLDTKPAVLSAYEDSIDCKNNIKLEEIKVKDEIEFLSENDSESDHYFAESANIKNEIESEEFQDSEESILSGKNVSVCKRTEGNGLKVSKEQLEILIKEARKLEYPKPSWTEMANILNNKGPCIKSVKSWIMFFQNYKNKIRKKIKKGAKVTKLEKKAIPPKLVRVSEEQLSLILKEKAKAEEEGKAFSWTELSTVLNAVGPSIKNSKNWLDWFSYYKRGVQKKANNGDNLTPMETKILLSKGRVTKLKTPSKEQLSILMREMSKPKHEKLPWSEVVKIINNQGPCIKSSCEWKQYLEFNRNRFEKINEAANVTQFENVATPQKEKVSEKQLSLILAKKEETKQHKKKFSWSKMSLILNTEGPIIKNPNCWRQWFFRYKNRIKESQNNGANLTPLQTEVCSFKKRIVDRTKVNEKQLSIILEKKKQNDFKWINIVDILNANGPPVKKIATWQAWFSRYGNNLQVKRKK